VDTTDRAHRGIMTTIMTTRRTMVAPRISIAIGGALAVNLHDRHGIWS